jgi:hypothetical protein
MSDTDKLEQLGARLAELQNDYATLATAKTIEDANKAAAEFCAMAGRDDVRGYILGVAAVGQPKQDTINAYVVSGDPRPFPEWAAEQAQAVDGIELSDRQRDSRLRRLGAEMEELRKQHNELRKAAAMAALEAEFAGDAA